MAKKLLKGTLTVLIVFSLLFNSLLGLVIATDYMHLGRLIHIMALVRGKGLWPISFSSMLAGATDGIVKSLKDPYSLYLAPADYTRLQNQMQGVFDGVGLIVDASKVGVLQVVSVIPYSPAAQAGILKGDLITAVNGQSVAQIGEGKAADLMRGPAGSEVILTIVHSKLQPKDYRVQRQAFNLPSVEAKILKIPEPIAYLKINSFTDQTGADISKIWPEISASRGIILDLRDNPGGSLEAAVEVAGNFLPKGPVVHLVDRNGKRTTYEVEGSQLNIPLVVLVNQGTASAAEIIAAAVQDRAAGLVVGTKTFGKGVVQSIYPLDKGTGLKLTTEKYLSPLGREINKVGIKPDVPVDGSDDQILRKGLQLLEQRI